MAKLSSRFAAFLCVLLVLQEFGPAHFADVGKHAFIKHKTEKGEKDKDESSHQDNEDEDADDDLPYDDTADLFPQTAAVQTSSKRGIFSTVFKAVITTGKVASITSSIAGLGNAVFRAIAGCCTDFPAACEDVDEFNRLKTQITEKSKRADDLQLNAENLQVWTGRSIEKFENILKEINEIADAQQRYIQSISPQVSIALNNATKEIKDIIKEKNANGEEVDYLQISSMYESAIESVMNIGFPLVSLLLPVGAKVYKYAKQRISARSTAKAEIASGGSFKSPPKSSPSFAKTKLGRFLSSTKASVTTRITNIKTTLNTKYSRTVKFATNIGKGFKAAFGFANAALQVWMIIQSRESCRQRAEEARKARDTLRKASVTFDEAITNITAAKAIMEESFTTLREKITEESVTAVLNNIKQMVEEVSSPSPVMVQVAVDMQSFLDRINEEDTYEQTYNLEESLLSALFKIPFTVTCYTNKVKMINYVVDLCKKGRASFDVLYSEAQTNFDSDDPTNPDNPQNCERRIGFRYVNKADLKKAWQKAAKEQGFSENCVLNDPAKKMTACSSKDNGYSAAQIAEQMTISEAEAQELIADCPEKSSLSPAEEAQVCSFRGLGLPNAAIAGALKLKQELVEKVQC